MIIKTRLLLWLVLVFTAGPSPAHAGESSRHAVTLYVSVFNDADLPLAEILRAEEVAAQVFAQAGLSIEWFNCGASADSRESQSASCRKQHFPQHLHIRIIAQSRNLNTSTYGVSYLGEDGQGCQADIFYSSFALVKRTAAIDTSSILGLVVAHELGHLLLGTNSHAASGLMRAHWNHDELAAAGKGRLVFNDEQAHALKSRLETQPVHSVFATD